MKTDRFFYSAAAGTFLLLTFIGFFAFFTAGKAFGGGEITPQIRGLVITHGLSITVWYFLFLAQSVLIASGSRQLHMKLGWAALVVAPVIIVSGYITAVVSVQHSPDFVLFAIPYPDFLLFMLVEVTAFAVFVTAGMLARKRPAVHRSMMLLASMSMILGSTARIPVLNNLFDVNTVRTGLLWPLVVLAAVFLAVRLVITRKLDRPLALGSGALIVVYFAAVLLCSTSLWHPTAMSIVGR